METLNDENNVQEKGLIQDMLGEILNFDHGLPATIIAMVKSPKKVVDGYFTSNKAFVNPFRYTVFILAVTTLISTFFYNYEQMFLEAMESGAGASMEEFVSELNEKVPSIDWAVYFENVQLVMINLTVKFNQLLYIFVLAPVLALTAKLFFRKKQPIFKIHYVLFLYTLATYSVFSVIITPVYSLIDFGWIAVFTNLTLIGYGMYVQGRYLDFKKISSYLLSFISILLGMFIFNILVALITYMGALVMLLMG